MTRNAGSRFCVCHALAELIQRFLSLSENIPVSVNVALTERNDTAFPACLQNVLRKRDQSQAEYEGRLEAAILRKQEDRTPVSRLLPLL